MVVTELSHRQKLGLHRNYSVLGSTHKGSIQTHGLRCNQRLPLRLRNACLAHPILLSAAYGSLGGLSAYRRSRRLVDAIVWWFRGPVLFRFTTLRVFKHFWLFWCWFFFFRFDHFLRLWFWRWCLLSSYWSWYRFWLSRGWDQYQ